MKIEAKWCRPITLNDGEPSGLIYSLDIETIPTEPGVYVFARGYDKKIAPIYIGETINLRNRISTHLKSVPLMKSIENSPNGSRILIYCTVATSSRLKAKSQVKIIEKALIYHLQAEGYELFNKKGTKLPTHVIQFSGNRTSEQIAPRLMRIKKALTPTSTTHKGGAR